MKQKRRIAVYTRISTQEQSAKLQENELKAFAKARAWEVIGVYSDVISGTAKSRPGLDALMADCRKRKVDAVLVWKFDRFARSLRHLVTALEEFKALDIDFISATEGVDTTVPSGELVFQIFGAIAQFERTLICERVKAGLTEAKRKGKRLGRPPIRKLTHIDVQQIKVARRKGTTLRKLATQFGTSLWSVYQIAQQ
jgi:DNA invertase Pin-like site-specific DNA recombinase